MSGRRPAAVVLVVALAAVAVATLMPIPSLGPDVVDPDAARIKLALADMLRNLVLMAPAGAAAAVLGLGSGAALLGGLALSAAIECAQLVIPGRQASPLDWGMNGAGAGLGALLAHHARLWLRPSPRVRRGLAALALAVALAAAAFTGPLLELVPTQRPLYGHWTPDLGHLARYAGRVTAARVDGTAVRHGAVPDSDALRAALAGDFHVRVEARAGPPPPGQAALLLVTDADGTSIFVLGPRGEDLVFIYRSRAHVAGLEAMGVRRRGVLADFSPGSELRVEARRRGADLCLEVNGDERCGLGPTVGDGWTLLMGSHGRLGDWRPVLGPLWLALLLAPLGYWAAPRALGLVVWAAWLLAVAGLVALPPLMGLLPTSPLTVAAAVAGLLAGRGLDRWGARWDAEAPAS